MTEGSEPPSRRPPSPVSAPPTRATPRRRRTARPSLRQQGELETIARIRRSTATGSGVRVGIGDDTAVLVPTPGAALLATTDLLVEGIHFRRDWAHPRDIGWKAMAVNLSDIAAMGGTPRWALVALALPGTATADVVDELYAGMGAVAGPHGVVVVGGDVSASRSGWMVNVTLLGEHAGTPKRRAAAAAGQAVAVTGTLGRSAAGLAILEAGATSAGEPAREELVAAHLRPTPRVREGRWLGAHPAVHAMIDCSDGLATDLGHICRESGVGARVALDRVPVAPSVTDAARVLGADPLDWATGGGEDYELLFTCDPEAVESIRAGLFESTGTTLTVIGRTEKGEAAVSYVNAAGEPVAIGRGYEHFHG